MAYAALVSLAQTIDKILQDHHQYSISPREKQCIISIHEYVIFLQAFLENFPEIANSVEGQITDVAYGAEDIMEDFILKHIRQHHNSKNQSLTCICHLDFQELEKITVEIESIARDVMEIKNSARSTDGSCVATSSSRPITAHSSKDIAMVGFEDNLLAIKGRLCGESSKLQVIPIYGMGGIGKTTLARNAFVDPLTVEHFQIRAWVTVSQDYSAPHNILPSLVVSVGAQCSEEHDESKMAETLYKSLKGRRYLIVMDDMWNTKVWDDVRRIFPDDNNGSRIMLTTRLLDVAAYPDSSSPLHEMHFMDPDQSWNLLRQKIFREEHCPLELENIGKEIARRCRGLPLAIVVVAGLLSTVEARKTQAYWEKIARAVSEAVTENDEQFADIVLSLSYNHLPQHLKPCFLYLGGFPEDYEIHVSKLTKIYAAEGFLKLPDASKSCEEAAEDYLEDLVRRSLVLVNRRKPNGKLKSCSIHDLVRHLCIRKAHEEKFFPHVMDRHTRRICPKSIKDQWPHNIHGIIDRPVSVRTVLCFQKCERLWGNSESFKLLRVLDVKKSEFLKFPVEVLELFHLRYLAFAYKETSDFCVPASILKLQNLQTLIICPRFKVYKKARNGVHFPAEIWRMPQLRHILVFNLDLLPSNHVLKDLHTLAQVTDFHCTERMVQMFPNLKKLEILYEDEYRIKWRVYQLHNLVHMHQLEELKIRANDERAQVPFWENLAFPSMLIKLHLQAFHFTGQDIATVGSLPNLEVLKLRFCSFEKDEWKTSEGEFCRLKLLQIIYGCLQCWITESSDFPSLKHLQLFNCGLPSGIPDCFGEIPTLEVVEVDDREFFVESAKSIQEEQQSLGNDALQVRVVSSYFDLGKFS